MIDISSTSYGMQITKLDELLDRIKVHYIRAAASKIDNVNDIISALDECWEGPDKEVFKKNLQSMANKVSETLKEAENEITETFNEIKDSWTRFQESNVRPV